MLTLDHVIIAVTDLDAATQDYRALGFTVTPGGVHANRATHNALITFANQTYIELLALTGEPPLPGLIDFSGIIRGTEGLVGYALRSDDLAADAARLAAHDFTVGEPLPGERRRADGTLVQWRLALIDGGFAPFLIQDVTPIERRIDPTRAHHANGAAAISALRALGADEYGIAISLNTATARKLIVSFECSAPLKWLAG